MCTFGQFFFNWKLPPIIKFISKNIFKDLFYLFSVGREGEKEGEKHQCVVASHVPPPSLTRNLARNPGMWPYWELNRQRFGLQASTQSTVPQQPGLLVKKIF